MAETGKYEKELLRKIREARVPDSAAMAECRRRWDALAKPLDGLGEFEKIIVRMAGMQGTPDVNADRRAAVIMCADHGVTCEGVTQTDSSVTASVARALAAGTSTVNAMAAAARADVIPVDMGMRITGSIEGVLDCSVARGTENMAAGPAMSREHAALAVLRGVRTAEELAGRGYRMLAAGEMGIGNTTASSAVLCVLAGAAPADVTGRGAGLPDELYRHKVDVVRRAVEVNAPDAADPLDVLSKIGGFEMGGMAGLYIGGAITGAPVVIDGFISAVSALLAQQLCPRSSGYMIASHAGREPASRMLMDLLGLRPVLDAGMALGEATGAVMLFPLIDVTLALYRNGETFGDIDLKPYERFDGR